MARVVAVTGGPIEAKPAASASVTLVAGYLAAVLISAVPWLHQHLTPDQQQQLPIIIAFGLSALAGYLAPHTHRPDLPPLPVLAPMPAYDSGAAMPPAVALAVNGTGEDEPVQAPPAAETGQGTLPAPPKA